MVDDKDIDTVMSLLPQDATYYWTQATTHRAIPCNVIAKKGKEHHLQGETYNSIDVAYEAAKRKRHQMISYSLEEVIMLYQIY